ncbi:ribonuclease J [[Clostridium] aminophilum]|uniref:Ribonuclease J n=1 Tax=[Clostridium] aminophilum TaxID=1526 RepID=A0A1I6JND6_9FIRM|nr:ribonuclease J [[Clostridium] aminophilum]
MTQEDILKKQKEQEPNHNKIRIIPLGGLEQIGMNMTAFEYGDDIIVVDCGMAFPSDDMLGIDMVIPDVTYLKENIQKVRGFVITHGHEDHIGALPYVLREIPAPVYSTKLTIGLIENKLKEHEMLRSTKRKVIRHGQSVNLGCFRVEFIKTNHSIQDASALAIFSPAGIIVHTGDFKIDYTPVFGEPADLPRFAELGKKGVLALMCDSTNAIRKGFTMSEKTVGQRFDSIFSEHQNQRIIVATFASNVDRVQQIINSAYKYGRKVVVEGRSMVNVIGVATELGYINIPENTLIDIDHLKNYKPEKTVLVTTGSQGESMAALSRMAANIHKKVSIRPGDVIILSSTPIPGNEKAVANVINELEAKGAEVINQDTHVSGHACEEEIKLMYSLVRPKYSIPVHGEFRHLTAQKHIAISMGVPKENVVTMQTGDVIEIGEEGWELKDHVQAGGVLVDGLGIGDVGNIVLRDRQNLAANGIIIVVLTLDRASNQLLAGPDIVSRGFVYVRESEDLMGEAQNIVDDAVQDCLDRNISDWGKIKHVIRDSLSGYLWKKMKRNPMILPIIMEVDE